VNASDDSRLAGRVAIVTGAGRGLGRAYALYLAAQGASVVVNDRGGAVDGQGTDPSTAAGVVAEIEAAGGQAVASSHDVSDWGQAEALVALAVEAFGDLHVLVNNAGIVRDRTLANMTEDEWDDVIRVHLKGHAATSHHAVVHWRAQAKSGRDVQASAIHTTSIAGLRPSFGQANYSAAKLGIAALSGVVALEGERYGIRSNAIAPSARTRIALTAPGEAEELAAPDDPRAFDVFAPEKVAPLVGWLAEADCPTNGQIFAVYGNRISVMGQPPIVHRLEVPGDWTPEALDQELVPCLADDPGIDAHFEPLSS
jgi:NAD(P)-dependent dehydrogenase (short-subunit alcohol dehydrogenase family)